VRIRDISILDYLQKKGIETRKDGRLYTCSSPFSTDSTWSFVIYPTNSFYDWSTGFGGGIVQLHSKFENLSHEEAVKDLKTKNDYGKAIIKEYSKKEFKLERYITKLHSEIEQIQKYAESRRITEGYVPAVFNEKKNGRWEKVLALGFVHVDKDLKPCGIKLRRITKEEPRFSARGKLGIYILIPEITNSKTTLTPLFSTNMLYVVEGEANANSLFLSLKKNYPVISMGGVASLSIFKALPKEYQTLQKKLIIDYDGNEELYQERLKLYDGLDAQPIKLILPKGQDINDLYCKDKMYLIENFYD